MTVEEKDLSQIAEQLLKIKIRLKALSDEESKLKSLILEAKRAGLNVDSLNSSLGTITITSRTTLQLKDIEKAYPAEKNPNLYSLTPNKSKIETHFTPTELDKFKKLSYIVNVKPA